MVKPAGREVSDLEKNSDVDDIVRERECGSLRVFSLLITKEHNNPLLYQLLYTKLLLSTQYTNILLSTQSTCDPSGVTDQTSDSWLKDLMLGSRDERPTSASTPARAVGDRHLAPRVIEHRR